MTVLGVHDGHDAGAALTRDSRALVALREERPLHVKLFKSLSPYVACHIFAKLYVRVLHRSRKMEHLRRVWWNPASKIARSMKSYLVAVTSES